MMHVKLPVPSPSPLLRGWRRLRETVRQQSGFSIAVTATVVLLLVAIAFDRPMKAVADALDPSTRAALKQLTRLGNSAWPLGAGLALLVPLLLAMRYVGGRQHRALLRVRSELLFFLGATALSGTIAMVAKNIIGRARPNNSQSLGVLDFEPLSVVHSWASFPSGHATTATAMMVALALILPRHAVGFVAFGLLVAFSRALIGVHWLSDVVAGIALGAAVTLLLRQWVDKGRLRPRMGVFTFRLVVPALQTAGQAWITTLRQVNPKKPG